MPVIYRAPEVVLKSTWDYSVDIWNVAMVAWDLVSPFPLFYGKNEDGIFDDRVHIAEMVALLGPPSPAFLERTKLSSVFWDENGKWKDLVPIPDFSFESMSRTAKIKGEDVDGCLRWMRAAMQWNPRDRLAAIELLYDEWLMEGLGFEKQEKEDD